MAKRARRRKVRKLARGRLDPGPSPAQAAEMNKRIVRHNNLYFEVKLDDRTWRSVRIKDKMPLRNPIQPKLSMLVFKLTPLIYSPFLSFIHGTFFITSPGVDRGVISWLPEVGMEHFIKQLTQTTPSNESARSFILDWRSGTPDAENWIRVQLALAAGERFRRTATLRPDEYVYSRQP